MKQARTPTNPADTITVSVPLAIRQRGGRKLVIAPDLLDAPIVSQPPDTTLVKAIARAYRWQRMLEEGTYASITDLAKAENISSSYVSRILRLTLLEPGLVEAIVSAKAA